MNLKKQLLLGAAIGALAAVSVTPATAQMPPVFNWTGFYVGGNVGYSWGHGAPTYNEPAIAGNIFSTLPATLTGANNLDGAIGGIQFGYNWQVGNWVYGLEADIQAADERAARDFGPFFGGKGGVFSATLDSNIQWFGTVRPRVGWLVTPTTMVYATGGLAYGSVHASGSFTDTSCSCMWGFDKRSTNVGYAAGGGVEGSFPNWSNWNLRNWTWKVEYLYLDLGTLSGSGFDTDFSGTYTYSARFTDNILRFGVNYNFH